MNSVVIIFESGPFVKQKIISIQFFSLTHFLVNNLFPILGPLAHNFRTAAGLFEPLIIHGKPLDDVLSQTLGRPYAELCTLMGFYPVTNRINDLLPDTFFYNISF
jgi:hypothetical protein